YRGDRYLRRRHVRILLDGGNGHRDRAREHNQKRDDRREDRPIDEQMREHAAAAYFFFGSVGFSAGFSAACAAASPALAVPPSPGATIFTGWPGITLRTPSTPTRSPLFKPSPITMSFSPL